MSVQRAGDYLDAVEAAKSWAKEAVVLAGLVPQAEEETNRRRVPGPSSKPRPTGSSNGSSPPASSTSSGPGNTRKGTGTFYTRPQLAVPTVHRTLQPLCYDKAEDGTLTPKTPEDILGLKVCDPACGQRLVPGGGAALPDRRPLQVALPPPQSRRPRAVQARSRFPSVGLARTPKPISLSRSHPTIRSGATRSRTASRPCCGGTSSSGASTAWTSTLWPWNWLGCRCGSRRSTPNCRSRSSTTRSRSATRWSAAGWIGSRTTRSRRGSGKAATARRASGHSGSRVPQREKVGNRRTGDGRIKQEMRQVIESKFSNQPPLFPDDAGHDRERRRRGPCRV